MDQTSELRISPGKKISTPNNFPLIGEANGEDFDPFDFETHSQAFELFSQYFEGPELYLRTAIWNNYIQYLGSRGTDVDKLYADLSNAPDEKAYLTLLTDTFVISDLLLDWYNHFNPEKVEENLEFIDETLEKYNTWEDILFNRLYRKYVDPEYEDVDKPLWFSSRDIEPETGPLPITSGSTQNAPLLDEVPLGEEDGVDIPERSDLIPRLQAAAIEPRRINLRATFQPKSAFLTPPQAVRTKASIVPTKRTSIAGERGIPLKGIVRVNAPSTLERSRVGVRVTPSTPLPTSQEEVAIDPAKLDPNPSRRGATYTVEELKSFLASYGLKRTGTKAVLVERLREHLGI